MHERLTAFPNRSYPNQESKSTLGNRVLLGINEINQVHKGKKIIIVAHGGVINSILASLSNGEIGSGKIELINACVSNIYFEQGQWQIKDFNQVSHLSEYGQKEII